MIVSGPIDARRSMISVTWVDDGDPFRHPVVLDSRLHGRPGQGQVLAGVDAENIVGPQHIQGHHLSSHRHQMFGASVR